jgi:hypothetical protein
MIDSTKINCLTNNGIFQTTKRKNTMKQIDYALIIVALLLLNCSIFAQDPVKVDPAL